MASERRKVGQIDVEVIVLRHELLVEEDAFLLVHELEPALGRRLRVPDLKTKPTATHRGQEPAYGVSRRGGRQ